MTASRNFVTDLAAAAIRSTLADDGGADDFPDGELAREVRTVSVPFVAAFAWVPVSMLCWKSVPKISGFTLLQS